MWPLMKEHSTSYSFAKRSNLSLIKSLDPATNLREIEMVAKHGATHHEKAISKILAVGNCRAFWFFKNKLKEREGDGEKNLWIKRLKGPNIF